MRTAAINTRRILLVAAENGALPGGKVGGVGDVIRDLPRALAARGWDVTVIVPGYDSFHHQPNARRAGTVSVSFAGADHSADIWHLPQSGPGLTQLAIDHALLSAGRRGQIYCDDPPERPFATDATKFAFFCAAVAAYVQQCATPPTLVHLHDWHAAIYLLLRAWGPDSARLQAIPAAFTIHNLAFQGIRPLRGDASSLGAWFPALEYPYAQVADPRYPDCVNPMAMAIRLADRVNTVSPSYAQEILCPSDPQHGFSGGEGLETELNQAATEERLSGILNGCEYPPQPQRRPGWPATLTTVRNALGTWRESAPGETLDLALHRIEQLPQRRPRLVLTSVGRLTAQKVSLFLQRTANGDTALEQILRQINGKGVLILVGSGDSEPETQLHAIARAQRNFLFLRGYSEELADVLYRTGDLFLMPSSFEPCGISQLLALRAGQPCVVHGVGGLRDTVIEGETGFVFGGDTPVEQAEQFVHTVQRATRLKLTQPAQWRALRQRAAAARFTWDAAAAAYEQQVYNIRDY